MGAEPAADDERPAAPTGLESVAPTVADGIDLRWDVPSDPCQTDIDHYLVTRAGDEVAQVPVGISRARIDPATAGEEPAEYGVIAVDEQGRASSPATTEAAAESSDAPVRLEPVPRVDGSAVSTVEPAQEVSVDLVVRAESEDLTSLEELDWLFELSAPCAVQLLDVSYGEAVTGYHEADIGRDGEIFFYAWEFADDVGDEFVIATIDLATRQAGATELRIDHAEGIDETHEYLVDVGDWQPLTIEPASSDGPPAPTNFRAGGGVSSSLELRWDSVENPCETDVSHYSVSVDGTEERTVPVGVDAARVSPVTDDPHPITVRAVDHDGVESPPALEYIGGTLVSDPGLLLNAEPSADEILTGERVEVSLELSSLMVQIPHRFEYEVRVSISSPCAAQITDVSAPDLTPVYDLYDQTTSIAADGSSATITNGVFKDDEQSWLRIATVELTGVEPGHTRISASLPHTENDDIRAMPQWNTLEVVERPDLPPVGVSDEPPQDFDGDGLYRDIDGTGRVGFNDVTTLFENLEEPEITEYATYYDFSGSGEVGFDDVIALFESL
ncbi:hypothetical protein GCM10025298_29450 [Natronobiforma cellulositropha]